MYEAPDGSDRWGSLRGLAPGYWGLGWVYEAPLVGSAFYLEHLQNIVHPISYVSGIAELFVAYELLQWFSWGFTIIEGVSSVVEVQQYQGISARSSVYFIIAG